MKGGPPWFALGCELCGADLGFHVAGKRANDPLDLAADRLNTHLALEHGVNPLHAARRASSDRIKQAGSAAA